MINYEGLFASLKMMWMGMAGLFVFAIFVMITILVMKFFMRKKEPKDIAAS
jgi:uncharacterized membrane protein